MATTAIFFLFLLMNRKAYWQEVSGPFLDQKQLIIFQLEILDNRHDLYLENIFRLSSP